LVVKHGTLQKDVVDLGDFSYAEGNWTMSNAQSSPEPATEAFVFGVSGFEGKGVSRGYWVRSRVKEFPAIYAGSYEHNGVIVQLSPKIAVAVIAPETTDIQGDDNSVPLLTNLKINEIFR
jgi:hypothetical protein